MLRDLAYIKRVLPRAVQLLDLRTSPLRASATDGTGGSSGIPDPTPLGGEFAYWAAQGEELAARLAEVGGGLKITRRILDQILAESIDTKAEALRHRCTGGSAMPGGDDPPPVGWRWVGPGGEECWNIAAPGRNDGLCDRCRQRKDRWQREHGERMNIGA